MFPHFCSECVTANCTSSLLAFSVAVVDLLISTCSRSLGDLETAWFDARLSVGLWRFASQLSSCSRNRRICSGIRPAWLLEASLTTMNLACAPEVVEHLSS